MKYMFTTAIAAVALIGFTSSAQAEGPDASVALPSLPKNTGTATEAAAELFTLSGTVDKSCAFYGNVNNSGAISLGNGTIGIRTEAGSQVFNQAADITTSFATTAAGCNTNNIVFIGTEHDGKLVNTAPGSYDNTQFTAEIPYSLNATWSGVAQGGTTAEARTVAWQVNAYNANAALLQNGAWRSPFVINITAPAQSKALVAGDYSDIITVQLLAQ